jgi:hypothetical protein
LRSPRSTKAGAFTPATRAARGAGRCGRAALNEGRGFHPGDTLLTSWATESKILGPNHYLKPHLPAVAFVLPGPRRPWRWKTARGDAEAHRGDRYSALWAPKFL